MLGLIAPLRAATKWALLVAEEELADPKASQFRAGVQTPGGLNSTRFGVRGPGRARG